MSKKTSKPVSEKPAGPAPKTSAHTEKPESVTLPAIPEGVKLDKLHLYVVGSLETVCPVKVGPFPIYDAAGHINADLVKRLGHKAGEVSRVSLIAYKPGEASEPVVLAAANLINRVLDSHGKPVSILDHTEKDIADVKKTCWQVHAYYQPVNPDFKDARDTNLLRGKSFQSKREKDEKGNDILGPDGKPVLTKTKHSLQDDILQTARFLVKLFNPSASDTTANNKGKGKLAAEKAALEAENAALKAVTAAKEAQLAAALALLEAQGVDTSNLLNLKASLPADKARAKAHEKNAAAHAARVK
jgi:hypothetical protein